MRTPPLPRDETLHLKLEGGGYPIYFRRGALTELAGRISALAKSGRVCIITDTRVAGLHTEDLAFAVRQQGPEVQVIEFAEGEQHKTFETVQQLYDDLLRFGVDRPTNPPGKLSAEPMEVGIRSGTRSFAGRANRRTPL